MFKNLVYKIYIAVSKDSKPVKCENKNLLFSPSVFTNYLSLFP